MSLKKLAELGWYKTERSSPDEISDLISIVERAEADAAVSAISDDLRFQAAYGGILALANMALRANGYRVTQSQGHHQRLIESREFTLTTQDTAARQRWVRKVKVHSQKRNITSYDSAGGVSAGELSQIRKDLRTLHEQVKESLLQDHPDLLEGRPGSS